MSVSEVAQRLKFSMRHIEALEADRYDALPGGPYARGMVRTYAKLLGIDAAPLLDALPRPADAGEAPMQPRDMSVPFPQDAHSGSRLYLLLSMLIIVAVVVVLAEWFLRSQRDVAAPERKRRLRPPLRRPRIRQQRPRPPRRRELSRRQTLARRPRSPPSRRRWPVRLRLPRRCRRRP